jgi:predicted CoA-binding protein
MEYFSCCSAVSFSLRDCTATRQAVWAQQQVRQSNEKTALRHMLALTFREKCTAIDRTRSHQHTTPNE